ncbi:PspC domain-containing protein [Paramicrobacterium fandaimingii]|uniref:PspC domain-containing protein n=1 Tax=Paramicrobacterium fandaimingii TaxID=2708079 RepID=UPI0014212A8D|nr:PspC domain-containing protein [Microbacterium fandaimingii]
MTNDNGQSQRSETSPNGWSAPGGFFDWIRGINMRRTDDRWVAGVCGGVAERTGLDPMLVRGIAIVVALLGGPIFLAYAVGWALLPDTTGRIHIQRMLQGIFDPALIAIGVLLVLTFIPFSQGLWWQGTPGWWGMPNWLEGMLRAGWMIVLVAGIIWLIVAISRKASQRGPHHPHDARTHNEFWSAGHAGPDGGQPSSFAAGTTGAAEPAAHSNPADAAGGPTDPSVGAPPAQSAPYVAPPSEPYSAYSGNQAGPAWAPSPAADHYAAAQQRQAAARAQHEARMRENAQRRAENAARWRERQPGAGYIAISLGLAVVGGALAALSALGWQQNAAVFGIAGALAVLAIATIIAGIRGRENGGLGFFSTVAVIALVFVGIVPQGAHFSAFGDTTWRVSQVESAQSQSYVVGLGRATLDLRELDTADDGGDINLWLGFGTADVIIPDDIPVEVRFAGAAATLDSNGIADMDGTPQGLFPSATMQTDAAENADASDITIVYVRAMFGTADVTVRKTP